MGGGRVRRGSSRQPGALGLKPGALAEKPSWHGKGISYLTQDKPIVCTKIYFRTGKWDLGPDDRKALIDTAKTMRTLVVNGNKLELRCRGYADVRHDADFNKRLSAKRIFAVEHGLNALLGHLKMWSLLPGIPTGETYSHNSPALWAEDRRVDVLVRVETEAEREARNNPWVKTRSDIFRLYSPIYHYWVDYGLDYLIDQYEQHDQEDYPVEVRPGDFENVYQLSLKVADPADRGFLVEGAKYSDREAVITDFYCVEYRKAYDEALRRYEASPEAGSLSPKR